MTVNNSIDPDDFSLFTYFVGEAQVRVAVEVAEQFIALTGRSKQYTKYDGVINRDILQKYVKWVKTSNWREERSQEKMRTEFMIYSQFFIYNIFCL